MSFLSSNRLRLREDTCIRHRLQAYVRESDDPKDCVDCARLYHERRRTSGELLEANPNEVDVCDVCVDHRGEPMVFRRREGCRCTRCPRRHYHEEFCLERIRLDFGGLTLLARRVMNGTRKFYRERLGGDITDSSLVIATVRRDDTFHVWMRSLDQDEGIVPRPRSWEPRMRLLSRQAVPSDLLAEELRLYLDIEESIELSIPPAWEFG